MMCVFSFVPLSFYFIGRIISVSCLTMEMEKARFASVGEMLSAWRCREPVYCIYPDLYREAARAFLDGFPGALTIDLNILQQAYQLIKIFINPGRV
jgi:hypothetical protein